MKLRGVIASAAVVAVVGFALVGSWHHHPLAAAEGHGLSPAEHASASAPCHVCKLSASGPGVPLLGDTVGALAPVFGTALSASFVPDRCVRPSTLPARAPPADAIA